MRRESVIRSLILYLGEKEEDLFEDCLVKHIFILNYSLFLLFKVQVNPKVREGRWTKGWTCSAQ